MFQLYKWATLPLIIAVSHSWNILKNKGSGLTLWFCSLHTVFPYKICIIFFLYSDSWPDVVKTSVNQLSFTFVPRTGIFLLILMKVCSPDYASAHCKVIKLWFSTLNPIFVLCFWLHLLYFQKKKRARVVLAFLLYEL